MKIGWLSDYNIVDNGFVGGGEITEAEFIKRKPSDIILELITRKNFKDDFDFYIVNNFRTFSKKNLNTVLDNKFIMAWRDVIETPHDDLISQLYEKAKLNIFLSPLHLKSFTNRFNVIKNNTCKIISPYFNAKRYRGIEFANILRNKDICWVGHLQHHKGIEECILWARDNNRIIDFYGKGNLQIVHQLEESKYANYKGFIDDISSILYQYKYFIHYPDKIETFGRSCMEAYLCECRIIRNNNIGMFSWDIFTKNIEIDDIIEWIERAPSVFWDNIKSSFSQY